MISLGGIQLYAVQKHSGEWSVKEVEQSTGYFVVKQKALPEVLLKVVEAKRLIESERTVSVQEATERVGMSRSSFYKYQDAIFPFHDTAAALAARGFVVAAPTHPRDCMANMDHLFLWEQLKNRALELSATMDLLLADKDIGPSIDPKRIGVLGYGSGATAALLLGGALPDCSGWMDYCRKAPLDDAYCYEQPRARMDSMCAHFPLDPRSLTDPRVKAIDHHLHRRNRKRCR